MHGEMKSAKQKNLHGQRGRGGRWGKGLWLGLRIGAIIGLFFPNLSQAVDFHCSSGDVNCLINAINLANANSEADTIILAENGTYTLSSTADARIPFAVEGNNGLPSITTEITIQGNGSVIERDASLFTVLLPVDRCSNAQNGDKFRMIHVAETGNLTLEEVTIQNGCADDIGDESDADTDGGGIYNGGTLTLMYSTVRGNLAGQLFGLRDDFGSGGGIYNDGILTLMHSTVSGNRASGEGGGISNDDGTVTLTHSTVSGNLASSNLVGSGGGIFNDGGTVTLAHSTVSENLSDRNGGGIVSLGSLATMTLTHSTVRGNHTDSGGGGILNDGTLTLTHSTVSDNTACCDGPGGGILNRRDPATLTLTNSTVSGNFSDLDGGGIFNTSGTVTLVNSTVTGNTGHGVLFGPGIDGSGIASSGTVTLTNSIVADQVSGADCVIDPTFGGTNTSNDFNLDSDGTCNLDQPNDQPNAIANLGPLQVNAPGNTATHALLPGSVAIDMGDCSGGTITDDQRGVPRPQGVACDIGAFEAGPGKLLNAKFAPLGSGDVATAFSRTPCGGASAGTFTITAAFTNASADTLSNLVVVVNTLTGGNVLCNANGGPSGTGATLTVPLEGDLADGQLSPGEAFVVELPVGLQSFNPFTFLVDVLGEED